MMKDQLLIYKNLKELSEGFTKFLTDKVLTTEKNISLSLSGGTTPKFLFDYWASEYSQKLPWEKMLFFWGDERCVAPDHAMSNYGMTKSHLFDNITIPNNNIFRVHGENEPEMEAVRYGNILDQNLNIQNEIPQFDLMILGLGDDGHTASIFPHEIDLWNSSANCVVATHPETGMKRISMTGKVINNAQHIAFLVTGKNKAEKVRDIIKSKDKCLNIYPAALVNPISENIYWFLDEEAASLL